MSNYTSVTIGNGETKTSNSGFDQGTMSPVNDIPEDQGKIRDLQDSRKQCGSQSCYIRGNEVIYQEGGPRKVDAPTIGNLPGTLATAKTPDGRPINDMAEIKPDSRIQVGRTQVEVKTAMHMGILGKDGNGNYFVKGEEHLKPGIPQAEAATQPKTPRQEVIEVDLSGTDGHRDVVNMLKTKVGSRITDSFMAQAMSAVVTGEPVDGLVADFAQQVGGNAGDVHNWVQSYVNTLYTNGINHMARAYGVDASALENYVSSNTSKAYQASLLNSLYHNNLKAADELMGFYRRKDRVGI